MGQSFATIDPARLTFVLTLRQGSKPTLENVATRERVTLTNLDEIPARIATWTSGPTSRGPEADLAV